MHVKEIWRYPVKSMAGERLELARLDENGVEGDRKVLVRGVNGRVITSRTHHQLLGLKGTTGEDGEVSISVGKNRASGPENLKAPSAWNMPEALKLVKAAVGPGAELFYCDGPERFDVLPLLVATDGAIAEFGYDGRRLRPNIVIGGVEELAERSWPGKCLRIGEVVIGVQDLRGRCVMTTYDPDTLKQNREVLQEIVDKFDGTLALNCFVVKGGKIRVGDDVELFSGKDGAANRKR